MCEVIKCLITGNEEKLNKLKSKGVTWEYVDNEGYNELAEKRVKDLMRSMI